LKSPLIVLLCIAVFGLSAELSAEENTRKVEFYIIHYQPGPGWVEGLRYEEQPNITTHLAYWQSLYYQEILLMSGPWQDDSGGIFILRANDRETVTKIVAQDPAVIDGAITTEINEWRVLSSAMRSVKPTRVEIKADESFRLERLDPSSPINLKNN
jgi:uncharacterized protein YciI